MIRFRRIIGIDYSGASTPEAPLSGLRVFEAGPEGNPPFEVRSGMGRAGHWSRQRLAEWLVDQINLGEPLLIGVDHSFSFPEAYFSRYLPDADWNGFLEDFRTHWPTHQPECTVRSLRNGNSRTGSARERRRVETLARAKSVFHFDVPGSVATSTHAGLPWLHWIRKEAGARLHFWPYDGTEILAGCSVIAETYPALWFKSGCPERWSRDQWDAFLIAETLANAARTGALSHWFKAQWPSSLDAEIAREGWILGLESQSLRTEPVL